MKSILTLVISGIVIILAPRIQTTGDPGAGYTWSLGDLAADSARLTDAVIWDPGTWSDAVDTEAELLALGWTSHTISANNCAATGDSDDESTVASQIAALCTAGDCGNKIMRFESSCIYDMTATDSSGVSGTAALTLQYSNVAYVGSGFTSSKILCNNTATASAGPSPCVSNGPTDDSEYYCGGGFPTCAEIGSTFTWDAGTALGAGSDGNEIDLATCTGLSVDDHIRLDATGQDGEALQFHAHIVTVESGCKFEIEPVLPIAITTPIDVVEMTAAQTNNTYFIGLQIGFPNIPDGTCSDDTGSPNYCANAVRWRKGRDLLITDSKVGPYGQTGVSFSQTYRPVVKHSEIGDGQMSKRRGTRSAAIGGNRYGTPTVSYDNVFTRGAKRMISVDTNSVIGSYFGFNYQATQETNVVGESGSHCDGVTSPAGIAIWTAQSPAGERSLFVGHDGPAPGVGAYLIETSEAQCQSQNEAASVLQPRYGTIFRTRFGGPGVFGSFNVSFGSAAQSYGNFIANRGPQFFTGNTSLYTNALGRWNVAENATAIGTPGSGSTWPTSGAGKNYSSETGPHDDYPLASGLPPSLAFQQDDAPDWWCQESGPWNGEWTFGAGDGYDIGDGAVAYRLPAQIRYEGTTCTAP